MPEPLLPFDTALAQVLALGGALETETVPIGAGAGRWLAVEATAELTQPPADVSAMDGYGLRFEDLPGPVRVVGESAAGRPFAGTVAPGEAVRIFTGAYVPAGADCVMVQEEAELSGAMLGLAGEGPAGVGANIRRRGLDFDAGQVLAKAGDRLTPARMGLLAAAGLGMVQVHRRPKVALLSTGDELVPVGERPGPGQIIGSNALVISTLLAGFGADVQDLGIVPDRAEALARAIGEARGADLMVTIGGASVGEHDLVRPALLTAGAVIDFWRIALRPGKPMLAGRLPDGPLVVGLPGNPVSAFVCARLFLAPLLRRMGGSLAPHDVLSPAVTTVPLAANGPRRDFLRGVLGPGPDGPTITPFGRQDSSLLSVLAGADALLLRLEHAPAVPAGTSVSVLTL